MSSAPALTEQTTDPPSEDPVLKATGKVVPRNSSEETKKAQLDKLTALLTLYENADANYNAIPSEEVFLKLQEIAKRLISLGKLEKYLSTQAQDPQILPEQLAVEAKASALIYSIGDVAAAVNGLEKSRVTTGDAHVQWQDLLFLWSHVDSQTVGAKNQKIAAANKVKDILHGVMTRISPEAVADPNHKIDQSTLGVTGDEQKGVLDAFAAFFTTSGFEQVTDAKKRSEFWRVTAKSLEACKTPFEKKAAEDRAKTATGLWNKASGLSTLKKKNQDNSEGPTPSKRKKTKANLGEDGTHDDASGPTDDQSMERPAGQGTDTTP